MKLYVAKIVWYDDHAITDHVVFAAHDFCDATGWLSSYFGEEHIETLDIRLINFDEPIAIIPEKLYTSIIEEAKC